MTTETDKIVDDIECAHNKCKEKNKVHKYKLVNADEVKDRLNEYFNTRQFVPIKSISEGKTGYTSGESRMAKVCECDCHMLIGGSGHMCPKCFKEIKETKGQVRE